MSVSAKRRKSRKKLDWRKPVAFLRVLLLITLGIIAVYYFSQSSFFALELIETEGNSKVTEGEIIGKSGLSLGMNYFALDTELVEKRLLSLPLIETVKVKKRLPDRVVVEIKEREARALFCAQDGLVVIDSKGYCLEKPTTGKSYDLPVITGIKTESAAPGEKVCTSKALQPVLDVLDDDLQRLVSEINIAQADSLVAYTRQGTPVLLGTPDHLPEKITLVVSYLDSLESVEEIDYVDIRSIHAPAVRYREKTAAGENLFSLFEN